jgi:hypothetical protein
VLLVGVDVGIVSGDIADRSQKAWGTDMDHGAVEDDRVVPIAPERRNDFGWLRYKGIVMGNRVTQVGLRAIDHSVLKEATYGREI